MSKVFKPIEGESVLLSVPIHWKNYIIPMVALVGASACLFVMMHGAARIPFSWLVAKDTLYGETYATVVARMETGVFLAIIAFVLCRLISLSYIRYYVTDKRVVSVRGVITRRTEEMLLDRCEMVDVKQNIYERTFDCGDILCTAAVSRLFLDDVSNVFEFKRTILKAISDEKNNRKNG